MAQTVEVEFEVLDPSSNAVVARHPDREYPGMLLQGDTLRNLLDELIELKGCLAGDDCEAALQVSEGIIEQIADLLRHYEKVLKSHDISLPYACAVADAEMAL